MATVARVAIPISECSATQIWLSLQGYSLFQRLVATADVLVTNMRPAALERLRCDCTTLRCANPRLVCAPNGRACCHSHCQRAQHCDRRSAWTRCTAKVERGSTDCQVYALLTAHGIAGPDADLPGYDVRLQQSVCNCHGVYVSPLCRTVGQNPEHTTRSPS